jgi:hypothetical protein
MIVQWNPALATKFSITGTLGDTFGGLTSPIINLVSVILLYLTLRSQNDSIKNQRKEFENEREFTMLSKELDIVHDTFVNTIFTLNDKKYTGIEAFTTFSVHMHRSKKLDDINIGNLSEFIFHFNNLSTKLLSMLIKNKESTLTHREKNFFYDQTLLVRSQMISLRSCVAIFYKRIENSEFEILSINDIVKHMLGTVVLKEFDDLFNSFNPDENKVNLN